MKSFLMLGQSNMAGRGRLTDVEPIANDKIFMLRNCKWLYMTEPINYDRPFAGIGLAASFADMYVKHYGEPVGLIPCADGGSSLSDWAVGGQLYKNAHYQALLAKNISTITGILWHQGESDCNENYSSYSRRCSDILDSLQKDLGINVPVIMGELGQFLQHRAENVNTSSYYKYINGQLKLLAERPGFALASAEGLTSHEDMLHFDAPSLRTFGIRYFEEYKKLNLALN